MKHETIWQHCRTNENDGKGEGRKTIGIQIRYETMWHWEILKRQEGWFGCKSFEASQARCHLVYTNSPLRKDRKIANVRSAARLGESLRLSADGARFVQARLVGEKVKRGTRCGVSLFVDILMSLRKWDIGLCCTPYSPTDIHQIFIIHHTFKFLEPYVCLGHPEVKIDDLHCRGSNNYHTGSYIRAGPDATVIVSPETSVGWNPQWS